MFTITKEVEEYARKLYTKDMFERESSIKLTEQIPIEALRLITLACMVDTIMIESGISNLSGFARGAMWMYLVLLECERLEMEKLANA